MSNVVLSFIADTSTLPKAEDALTSLMEKDHDLGVEAAKTAAIYKERAGDVNTSVKEQIKSLDALTAALKSSEKGFTNGASKQFYTQLQKQVELLKKQVSDLTKELDKYSKTNDSSTGSGKKLYDQTVLQTGIIGRLRQQLEGYRQALAAASTPEDIARINKVLEQTEKNLKAAGDAGKEGFDEVGNVLEGVIDKAAEGEGALAKGFNLLKTVANTLPGIGLQGIFLLIFEGIKSAAEGLDLFSSELSRAETELKLLADAQKETADVASSQITNLQILYKTANDVTASDKERTNAVKALKAEFPDYFKNLDTEAVKNGEARTSYDLLTQSIISRSRATVAKKRIDEENSKLLDIEQKKYEGSKDAVDALSASTQKLATNADKVKKLSVNIDPSLITEEQKAAAIANQLNQQRVNSATKTQDALYKIQEDEIRANIQFYTRFAGGEQALAQDIEKATAAQIKAEEDKAKKLAEARAKAAAEAEFEIRKRALEQEIAIDKEQVGKNDSGSLRLVALQSQLDAELQLINLERDKELSAENLTASQIANINDKARVARLNAETDFGKQKQTIITQYGEQQKAYEATLQQDIINQQKARFDNYIKQIKSFYTELSSTNSREQDAELDAIQSDYDKNLIDFESYEAARANVKAKYAATMAGNEVARLQAEIAENKAAGMNVEALEKQLYDAKERLRQADVAANKDANRQKEKDDADSAKRRADVERQIKQETFTLFNQIISGFGQNEATARQNQLQSALAGIAAARDEELNNKNLTEQQKSDIQKRYAEKERQAKIKGFNDEKEASRRQAIIKGALAFLNALATVQPLIPAGLIAAGATVASTFAQVAIINSQPTPRFRHGKVGIEGPGTTTSDSIHAMISRGESVINAQATEKHKALLEAINSDRLEQFQMLESDSNKISVLPKMPEIPATTMKRIQENNTGRSGGFGGNNLDMEKFAELIATKMVNKLAPKIPAPAQITNILDGNSIRSFMRKGNQETEFLNKRYSTE